MTSLSFRALPAGRQVDTELITANRPTLPPVVCGDITSPSFPPLTKGRDVRVRYIPLSSRAPKGGLRPEPRDLQDSGRHSVIPTECTHEWRDLWNSYESIGYKRSLENTRDDTP
jgi:hypothetical protein